MRNRYRKLSDIEKDIRNGMSLLASAPDEDSAAGAFQEIQRRLADYFRQANEMNREHWKLRDTTLKQAQTIAAHDIRELGARVGEAAPPEPHLHIHQPESISVENSPDFHFIRLSYGLVNIRHIVELDVKARMLHTTRSVRHLNMADTRILVAQLKLYPAPEFTSLTGTERKRLHDPRKEIQAHKNGIK